MKCLLAILTASVLIGPAVGVAQEMTAQAQASPSLVDVAKAEEARRKSVRKPAKVYTNNDLKPDNSTVRPAPSPAPSPSPALVTPPSTTVPAVDLPGGTAAEPASDAKGQSYWSGRITAAQAGLERSRVMADALQSRINALTTDFVNRDDPAQRAVIETNRKTALAELDRVRLEIEAQQKAIAAIEEEARRAGVPSGWLRPGA